MILLRGGGMIEVTYRCRDCKKHEEIKCEGLLLLCKGKDGSLRRTMHHLSRAEVVGMMVNAIWEMLKK
ncbi:MAG: hypothetical protein JRD89_10480 [Deltaproteobacteria bacterium]|nr:hypothetical protein [Deltaproteobacteria bacterium]